MAHRPKRPRDANLLAKSIVDVATGDAEDEQASEAHAARRKGGERGGKARAEKLTPEKRSEIARKAAKSRWKASAAREKIK